MDQDNIRTKDVDGSWTEVIKKRLKKVRLSTTIFNNDTYIKTNYKNKVYKPMDVDIED